MQAEWAHHHPDAIYALDLHGRLLFVNYDALTGLPSRILLQDRLDQAIVAARRTPLPLALLLLDLDRFRDVNDTLGHDCGDRVIQEAAERLRRVLRASDTVARLGGDEFAVLLPGDDRAGAVQAARKITAALEAPIVVAGQRLHVGASIGIALYPDHGTDSQTLLRRADVAMYGAKRRGIGHAVYTVEQDEHSPERLALVAALHHAIAHDELRLHYQPEVDVCTRRITGVEALVRWQHPRLGLVLPDQFIHLAEGTGLIGPLTRWVLKTALRQYHYWRQEGLNLGVAINLSASSLRDPRLAEAVIGLLLRYKLPPDALRVELTESTLMADATYAVKMLKRLADRGVQIAIDDFGTGYSSLAYLKHLPVAELKIDKSFVQHMAGDAADAAIVSSTIGLAHSLGLRVVAEGVESAASWDLLAAMSCDAAQGYYLSRPLPADALASWLRNTSWAVAS